VLSLDELTLRDIAHDIFSLHRHTLTRALLLLLLLLLLLVLVLQLDPLF
jgi:hypothetical protein